MVCHTSVKTDTYAITTMKDYTLEPILITPDARRGESDEEGIFIYVDRIAGVPTTKQVGLLGWVLIQF